MGERNFSLGVDEGTQDEGGIALHWCLYEKVRGRH